jgi:hypothetical protein
MTRKVERERSILGTELEEPKIRRSGRGGDGECVEKVTDGAVEAQGNLARLAPGPKNGLKRRVGCGGKGPRKQLPKVALFRPPFTDT